jgi:hypothetical protein
VSVDSIKLPLRRPWGRGKKRECRISLDSY